MKLPHRFPFSEGKQKEPARKCRLFRLKTGPETRTQVDGSHDEGMLAGLAPIRASASRPDVGPVLDVAELRRARSCFVYDVFWLLSFGLSVSAPALFSRPSFVGSCTTENSSPALLRRLFPPKIFQCLALRGEGPPSATSKQACQQPKNNGEGRRDAGRVTPLSHPRR
jgi:hypothetical protein